MERTDNQQARSGRLGRRERNRQFRRIFSAAAGRAGGAMQAQCASRARDAQPQIYLQRPCGKSFKYTSRVMTGALFLAAYASSGLAALIYEVAWVRTLTLYMGHSTAATSTVVAAFMGGMAAGAALGGRLAGRLTPHRALIGYAALEAAVVLTALAMPFELRALTPI